MSETSSSSLLRPSQKHSHAPWYVHGLWWLALVSVVVGGGAYLGWTARSCNERLRGQLLGHARDIAQSVNVNRVTALTGSAADARRIEYHRLKDHLRKVRPLFFSCKSVYILRKSPDGQTRVLVNSEAPDMQGNPPAGTPFSAIAPSAAASLEQGAEWVTPFPLKSFSSQVRAFVALHDPATGHAVAVMGMDMDSRYRDKELLRLMAWPCVFTLAGIGLIAALRNTSRRRWQAYASGDMNARPYIHVEFILSVLLGVTATTAATHAIQRFENEALRSSFDHLVHGPCQHLATLIQDVRNTQTEGLKHFIEGSEDVTASEFRTYAEFLIQDPSALGWGWAPVLSAAQRAEHERRIRQNGAADYQMWYWDSQRRKVAAPAAEACCPVTYFEGSSLPDSLAGFDFWASPDHQKAVREAYVNRLITASDAVQLPPAWPQTPLSFVFTPVLSDNSKHPNHGIIFSVLQWDKILARMVRGLGLSGDWAAFRLQELRLDGESLELAASGNGKAPASFARTPWHIRPFMAFGQTYVLFSTPGAQFSSWRAHTSSGVMAVTGGVLTLVLALLIGHSEGRKEELVRMVKEQTRDLEESEEFSHSTLNGLSAQIAILDMEGRILAVNRAWHAFAGAGAGVLYSSGEGENYLSACDDSFAAGHGDAGQIATVIRSVLAGRGGQTGIICSGHTLREKHWFAASITPFPTHRLARAIVAYEDITARVLAEESEHKLSTAVEQDPAMVMIVNTGGQVEYANRKFVEISGFTLEEVRGRPFQMILAPDIPEESSRGVREAFAQGMSWRGEFQNRRKDGAPYWHRVILSPLRDRAGNVTHFMIVGEDITQQRNIESQLLQSQKMETVGRLAGGIAHDFNNLLQVILGSTEFALMEAPPSSKITTELEEIRRAAEKSAELTRQLLAFARKQTIQPRVLELNQTVAGLMKILQRLIGENIELDFKPGTDIPTIKMDPAQIDQILANLVVNARDAISKNGRILITTERVELRKDEMDVGDSRVPGIYARLVISDNGCGMDEKIQTQIFEPFFTTKKTGAGTGLGLSTVYGIVEQNHGFINLYSEPGRGTVFRIYLPATEDAVIPVAEPTEVRGGTETVLVVEDNPLILRSVHMMLQKLGYTVLSELTPSAALSLAAKNKDKIALLLSDVIMPGMNGRELAEAMHTIIPGLPCLYMSGYTSDVIASHGTLDGGMHFIEKPFSQTALAKKVREALESHPPPIAPQAPPPTAPPRI